LPGRLNYAALVAAWDLLAALGGAAVGLLLTVAFYRFRVIGERGRRQATDLVPQRHRFDDVGDRATVDTLVDVLGALRVAAVVVGRNRVVRATPTAYGFGLALDNELRHEELRALVVDAFELGGTCEADLELTRGLVGSVSINVVARVTPIGHGVALLLVEDRSEARRVDEVRRDFVANVSHELKTPVGAISLLAETMADAADDPAAIRHFSERMRVEAERLTRLVQDIIELSRLQVVDALTATELIDIDRLVSDAVDQARWRAEAQRIDIEVGAATSLRTYGDHYLLTTAVRNLLDNAIAYSPPQTKVSVVVGREDGFVEVRVTDHGNGIPLAEQKRIFERFYRVDPGRSRQTGGTGLGLAIVKHISENHGGEVTVWSRPGQGSTFTLRLPVSESDSVAPPTRPVTGDGQLEAAGAAAKGEP